MTTWTEVSDQNSGYESPTDIDNGYVVFGYVQNDYILPERIWTDVSDASTVWA